MNRSFRVENTTFYSTTFVAEYLEFVTSFYYKLLFPPMYSSNRLVADVKYEHEGEPYLF